MTRRLEHRSPSEAWWVTDLADGRQERVGPLAGRELLEAHAQINAQRELEAVRAEVAEHAQRTSAPPAPRAPYRDPAQPTSRMHERPMSALGMPVNSSAPDLVRAGWLAPDKAATLRRATTHHELES